MSVAPDTLTPRSAIASLLFWVCLFVAVGMYGVCALSSRVVAWADLDREYRTRQSELIGQQREVRHLQNVADALQNDPEFAERLARSELAARTPGAEVITLPEGLTYDPLAGEAAPAQAVIVDAWYVPVLQRVATDDGLRRKLWVAAAALMLFAFGVLHNGRRHAWLRGAGRRVFGRYIKHSERAP
jgi:hypothetical protein